MNEGTLSDTKINISPRASQLTKISHRLGEIIGKDVAGKLHTGRSRNDQVATDMRMWLRDELRKIELLLKEFLNVIAQRAEKEIDYLMPG